MVSKVTMNENSFKNPWSLPDTTCWSLPKISMKDKDVYNAYHKSLENRRILPDHEVTAGCQTGILAKTGYHCWTFFNLLSGRITDKITAVQDIKKMVIVPKSCLNSYVTSELPKYQTENI